MPSAPGRLSITTGFPQRLESFSANRRTETSPPVPDGNGVTRRTGRCGQASARAFCGGNVSAEITAMVANIALAKVHMFRSSASFVGIMPRGDMVRDARGWAPQTLCFRGLIVQKPAGPEANEARLP